MDEISVCLCSLPFRPQRPRWPRDAAATRDPVSRPWIMADLRAFRRAGRRRSADEVLSAGSLSKRRGCCASASLRSAGRAARWREPERPLLVLQASARRYDAPLNYTHCGGIGLILPNPVTKLLPNRPARWVRDHVVRCRSEVRARVSGMRSARVSVFAETVAQPEPRTVCRFSVSFREI
jgi:hypothetical protein